MGMMGFMGILGGMGKMKTLWHFEGSKTGFKLADVLAFALAWSHDETLGHDDAIVGSINLRIADERTPQCHFLHFPKSAHFKYEVAVNFQILRLNALRIVRHVLSFVESLHVFLHEFLTLEEEIVDEKGIGRCVRIGIHAEVQQVVVFPVNFGGSPEEVISLLLDVIDVVGCLDFTVELLLGLVHDSEAELLFQFGLLA